MDQARDHLGEFGIWRGWQALSPDLAAAIEAAGYGTLWVGSSPDGDLAGVDYFLLLEEDLEFNRYLDYNLRHWKPLLEGGVRLAGLSNPRVRELACDIANNARLMDARSTPLSGALLALALFILVIVFMPAIAKKREQVF